MEFTNGQSYSTVSIQQKLSLFCMYVRHFIDMENESASYGRSLSLVIHILVFPSHLFMHDFREVSHFTDSQPRKQISLIKTEYDIKSKSFSRRSFQIFFGSATRKTPTIRCELLLIYCNSVETLAPQWHARFWHHHSLSEDVSFDHLLREA